MLFTPCVPCFTGLNLSEVIPDEPAVLQELEDRVLDRLLRKVREEAGSEEPGELKYIDTASMGKSWVLDRARFSAAILPNVQVCDLCYSLPKPPLK